MVDLKITTVVKFIANYNHLNPDVILMLSTYCCCSLFIEPAVTKNY